MTDLDPPSGRLCSWLQSGFTTTTLTRDHRRWKEVSDSSARSLAAFGTIWQIHGFWSALLQMLSTHCSFSRDPTRALERLLGLLRWKSFIPMPKLHIPPVAMECRLNKRKVYRYFTLGLLVFQSTKGALDTTSHSTRNAWTAPSELDRSWTAPTSKQRVDSTGLGNRMPEVWYPRTSWSFSAVSGKLKRSEAVGLSGLPTNRLVTQNLEGESAASAAVCQSLGLPKKFWITSSVNIPQAAVGSLLQEAITLWIHI